MYEIEEIEKLKDAPKKVTYKFANKGSEWALINLKAGAVAGEHYHKGTSKIKNPEILIQISGKAEYFFKDMLSGKQEKIIVESPNIIKINPNVYHEVKAIEDIILLEQYSEDGEKDKFDLR
ncbi:MAG: cupin domain-containing protein [Patescibacteria group bacterium]|nr:cupin domain-containing protein [Patescibacteria group bacterium]